MNRYIDFFFFFADYSEQTIEVLQYSLPVILATLTFILVAYAVNKYIHVNKSSQPHSLVSNIIVQAF